MEHGHVMLIAAYSLGRKTLYIEQWGAENSTSKFNNKLKLSIYIPKACIKLSKLCERYLNCARE